MAGVLAPVWLTIVILCNETLQLFQCNAQLDDSISATKQLGNQWLVILCYTQQQNLLCLYVCPTCGSPPEFRNYVDLRFLVGDQSPNKAKQWDLFWYIKFFGRQNVNFLNFLCDFLDVFQLFMFFFCYIYFSWGGEDLFRFCLKKSFLVTSITKEHKKVCKKHTKNAYKELFA